MSAKHPIDELFRKHLEAQEPEFNEAYWQEAVQVINRHERTSRISWKWKLFTLVAVSVMLCGAIGYYSGLYKDEANKNESPTSTVSYQEQKKAGNKQSHIISSSVSIDTLNHEAQRIEKASIQHAQSVMEQATPLQTEKKVNGSAAEVSASGYKASDSSTGTNEQSQKNYRSDKQEKATTTDPNKETTSQEMLSAAFMKAEKNDSNKVLVASIHAEEEQLDENNKNNSSSVADKRLNQNNYTTSNYNQLNEELSNSFIPYLSVPEFNLSLTKKQTVPVSAGAFSPSTFMRKNHWSKVRSFELSATGGMSIITVPATKSNETGFEWNALLHYRINNWLTGAGVGQFAVKDHFTATLDSVIDQSFLQQTVTVDSMWSIDSFFVVIDSIPVLVYDSVLHFSYDTSYQQIVAYDTISHSEEVKSSGRYFEIPVVFGYRFPIGKFRLQVTGGAAYGWYSGGLRYSLNNEGQLISYHPGAVVSLLGRMTLQYPIQQKIFLQGYTGIRYVMGLKKDVPEENYLLYSFGVGLLYRF
ncbi:MAG: hypothetical protein IPO83_06775 [Chitinophagaceae bacterium]|nr:hypothetical protein [Chitinophagaceae bacterium]